MVERWWFRGGFCVLGISSLAFGCADDEGDVHTAGTSGSAGASSSGGASSGASGSAGSASAGRGGSGSGGAAAAGSGGTPMGSGGSAGSANPAATIDCSRTGAPLSCEGGQVCCPVQGGGNHCATDCAGAATIGCDGPEDCGGRACCLVSNDVGTRCAAGASCESPEEPVCHELTECPTDQEWACCSRTGVQGTLIGFCGPTFASCI
jgi:hypothetical protein